MLPIDKLVLGTVQLGLDYGINNTSGKPSLKDSVALLQLAYSRGIKHLDTAEAYGNAQEVIGIYHKNHPVHKFQVITKCKPGPSLSSAQAFRDNFLRNLEVLQVDSLEALLFHNYDLYKSFRHWDVLTKLQEEKGCKKVGVSIYTNEEAIDVAKDQRVNLVQMPYNLLDNYSKRGMALECLKQNGKEIHTRSVFLQGLFFKNREALGKLVPLHKSLQQLDEVVRKTHLDIKTLALAYALQQPLIDKILIGVESEAQLNENVSLVNTSDNVNADILAAIDAIQVATPQLLNPSNWL